MAALNWDEYKEFKVHSTKEDRLEIAIDFIKSYYNMSSPSEIYDMLKHDDIGNMMLEKRDITEAEELENFMFQS